jgi:hypothetical protein
LTEAQVIFLFFRHQTLNRHRRSSRQHTLGDPAHTGNSSPFRCADGFGALSAERHNPSPPPARTTIIRPGEPKSSRKESGLQELAAGIHGQIPCQEHPVADEMENR